MLRGGCFCGAVRYETEATPFHETVCHCADCRRAVGAVSVAWFTVARPALRFVSGTPTRFRSSPAVVRSFCPCCGTSLTFESDALPEEVDVTLATLDDPDAVPPRDHVHAARRPGWAKLGDDLPVYPGSRP